MRILNFGSLNIDHVYQVRYFVRPGETLSSEDYKQFSGGKGGNQSIALAHAGANVWHAGVIGKDGIWLKKLLSEHGVDTSLIEVIDAPSGHAIIQVNQAGENAIILHGGANKKITEEYICKVLSHFHRGDYLLLQNEINAVDEIIKRAADLGLKIFFNPAPMHHDVLEFPLKLIDCFLLNEVEGLELTGEQEPDKILSSMREQFPGAMTVLTLGSEGVLLGSNEKRIRIAAEKVKPVDTTAAGDTFIGFYIAAVMRGRDLHDALKMANKAAALCVSRHGAADSIPKLEEISG